MEIRDVKGIELFSGSHSDPNVGMCAMEAVAWLAGEPHSDAPACACPAITAYVIKLNDRMDDANRQRLKAYLPRIIGTRDGNEVKRAEVFAWAAVLEFAPAALRSAGLENEAKKLEACAGKTLGDAAKAAYATYAYAYANAAYAANDAAYAANAAAYAAAYAANAAAYAANAAAYAANDAAYAANAAAYAANDANDAVKDLWAAPLAALDRAIKL